MNKRISLVGQLALPTSHAKASGLNSENCLHNTICGAHPIDNPELKSPTEARCFSEGKRKPNS